MTDHHLDTTVTPADQRRAAELPEAFIHEDGGRVGELLGELLDAGPTRALAVTAVLARNLAATLVAQHGREGALRILEGTRLDAAVADDDHVV